MRIHLQCKGWLAFQVTKQAQSTWQHMKSHKPVLRRGCKVSTAEKKTIWWVQVFSETTQIQRYSDAKDFLLQCTLSLKSSYQVLISFIQAKGVFKNKQLPGNSWHVLSPKSKTNRFPEVEGIAFRKQFSLAGSYIEYNSLFPAPLHVTGGLEFGLWSSFSLSFTYLDYLAWKTFGHNPCFKGMKIKTNA